MRVEEVVCDRCGANKAEPFSFAFGRCCDAAGSVGDKTLDADLCRQCKGLLLEYLIKAMPVNVVEAFLRTLKPMLGKGLGESLFKEHP